MDYRELAQPSQSSSLHQYFLSIYVETSLLLDANSKRLSEIWSHCCGNPDRRQQCLLEVCCIGLLCSYVESPPFLNAVHRCYFFMSEVHWCYFLSSIISASHFSTKILMLHHNRYQILIPQHWDRFLLFIYSLLHYPFFDEDGFESVLPSFHWLQF